MSPSDTGLRVYCDEQADLELFDRIKRLSASLSRVKDHQVALYPQYSDERRHQSEWETIAPLFEYDRPDFIVTRDGTPVLVVELTEHAYTGDNGLQRFGRLVSAAEHAVPFIYFGPLARVRDDEMDLADDPSSLSKRSLTSDFFEGAANLHRLFDTPVLFVEWKTGINGKVVKVPAGAGDEELSAVYGELVALMVAILWPEQDGATHRPNDELTKRSQETLLDLSTKKNTSFSDVRMRRTEAETRAFIRKPSRIVDWMPGYFQKGKPQKSLGLHGLQEYETRAIRVERDLITEAADVTSLARRIEQSPIWEHGAILYYTGYEWRPDPHSGVAMNLYYRDCVLTDRKRIPLIVVYPRISLIPDSGDRMLQGPALRTLFKNRYGSREWIERYEATVGDAAYGTWTVGTKQARVFSKYAALVVCNDGFVVGHALKNML